MRSPRRAFLTSLAATASNPTTIGSWAAIFAAASAAGVARSPSEAAAMLAGVGIGSLAWFVVLSCGVALARRHVGDSDSCAPPTLWSRARPGRVLGRPGLPGRHRVGAQAPRV